MTRRILAIACLVLAMLLSAAQAGAVEVARITVGTSATLLYGNSNSDRTMLVLVRNPSGVSLYVGSSDVTTANGFELAAGAAMSINVEPTDSLWGVVAASTQVIHRIAAVK